MGSKNLPKMAHLSPVHGAILLLLFVLFSSAAAHNITRILTHYPDFSSFSDILTQTGLDAEINRRQTITVLAVANSELDAVSGRQLDVVKKIAAVHVILDYFDSEKLSKLSKKSTLLTTLFQTTGQATGQAGFINVTTLEGGKVAFGSAVAGAGLDVYLEKTLATQPYNISVLQVSGLIVPPGIETNSPPAASTPSPAPKKSPSPTSAPSPKKSSSPSHAPTQAPDAGSAAPTTSESPSAADGGEGSAPSGAPAADAATPTSSVAASPGPTADGPGASDAGAPEGPHSSAPRTAALAGLAVAAVALAFAAF